VDVAVDHVGQFRRLFGGSVLAPSKKRCPTATAWASRNLNSRTSRQPMALAKRVTLATDTPAFSASSPMLALAAAARSQDRLGHFLFGQAQGTAALGDAGNDVQCLRHGGKFSLVEWRRSSRRPRKAPRKQFMLFTNTA
jgi:hypothetical protein